MDLKTKVTEMKQEVTETQQKVTEPFALHRSLFLRQLLSTGVTSTLGDCQREIDRQTRRLVESDDVAQVDNALECLLNILQNINSAIRYGQWYRHWNDDPDRHVMDVRSDVAVAKTMLRHATCSGNKHHDCSGIIQKGMTFLSELLTKHYHYIFTAHTEVFSIIAEAATLTDNDNIFRSCVVYLELFLDCFYARIENGLDVNLSSAFVTQCCTLLYDLDPTVCSDTWSFFAKLAMQYPLVLSDDHNVQMLQSVFIDLQAKPDMPGWKLCQRLRFIKSVTERRITACNQLISDRHLPHVTAYLNHESHDVRRAALSVVFSLETCEDVQIVDNVQEHMRGYVPWLLATDRQLLLEHFTSLMERDMKYFDGSFAEQLLPICISSLETPWTEAGRWYRDVIGKFLSTGSEGTTSYAVKRKLVEHDQHRLVKTILSELHACAQLSTGWDLRHCANELRGLLTLCGDVLSLNLVKYHKEVLNKVHSEVCKDIYRSSGLITVSKDEAITLPFLSLKLCREITGQFFFFY